jgi:transcriptional regulator with XRE-family HTH domain
MFHFRLQSLREDNDLTQEELSKILSINRSTLANYEAGTREPNFALLIKIADYFNVSLDYLLGRIDDLKPFKKNKV